MPVTFNSSSGFHSSELARYLRYMDRAFKSIPGNQSQTALPLFTILRRIANKMENNRVFVSGGGRYYGGTPDKANVGVQNTPSGDTFTISGYQGGTTALKVPEARVKKVFREAEIMARRLLSDDFFGNTPFELLVNGMKGGANRRVKLFHYTLLTVFMAPTILIHELGMDWSWTYTWDPAYDWTNAPETLQKSKQIHNLAYRAYRWYSDFLTSYHQRVGMLGVTDPKFKKNPSIGEYLDFLDQDPEVERLVKSIRSLAMMLNSALQVPQDKKTRAPNKLQI